MRNLKVFLALSWLGTLFALGVTLRQMLAPTTEPGIFSCVGFTVFGYSPCPFGLAFFALMAILSSCVYLRSALLPKYLLLLRLITTGGVLFSGWVAWREVGLPLLLRGSSYWESLSLWAVPACAWGFIVFVAAYLYVWRIKVR